MREVMDLTAEELEMLRMGECGIIEATAQEVSDYLDGSGPEEDAEIVFTIVDTSRHNVHTGSGRPGLVVIRIVPGEVALPEETDEETPEHENLVDGDEDGA